MKQNNNKNIILQNSQETRLSDIVDVQTTSSHPLHLAITIAAGATVNIIDDLHDHTIFNTKIECLLQEAATLSYLMKAVESFQHDLIEKEIIIRLIGRGARAEVTCVCFGSEKKVFKFKTLQDHQVEQATSNVVIKSVLDDESKLYCHSLIHVNKQAQQTVAEQVNKNILLKNSARAVSIPTLEVLANDVRCKHGAAVSKLNDEQIFYLQSRGIDHQSTRNILIQAFLN